MPYITLSSGLTIKVPTKTTRNWADVMQSETFQKISEHDHTGLGKGLQIGTSALVDNSITAAKIRLLTNTYLKSRNNGDSANVNLIKSDATDQVDIADSAVIIGASDIAISKATISLTGATTVIGETKLKSQKSYEIFPFTDGASNETVTNALLDSVADSEIGAILEYSVVREGTADLREKGTLAINFDGTNFVFSQDYTGDDSLVVFNFNAGQLEISNTANPGSTSEALYFILTKLGA